MNEMSGAVRDRIDALKARFMARCLDDADTFEQLSARLEQLAARADAVLAAYGSRSDFNNETVNLMREMRRAAYAFGSLARTIERNPQAFILGR